MFEPYNFVRNLEYMGKGMLAIFVVMIIIYLVVVLMQKIGPKGSRKSGSKIRRATRAVPVTLERVDEIETDRSSSD